MDYNPVIVAIDSPDLRAAGELSQQVKEDVGFVKLGLEFFCANGPEGIKDIRQKGAPVFLDLKLHDIPNTVTKSLKQLCHLDVDMTTIHALNGSKTMRESCKLVSDNSDKLKLLAVTILTSHSDIEELGIYNSISDQVLKLAELAVESGIKYLVCSPEETILLKKEFGDEVNLVVPGVRPKNFQNKDDQSRTATPNDAIQNGADYIVVGRPITQSQKPVKAVKDIVASIES